LADVDPSLFSDIGDWQGFAAVTPVPEPATASLALLGLGALLRRRRLA